MVGILFLRMWRDVEFLPSFLSLAIHAWRINKLSYSMFPNEPIIFILGGSSHLAAPSEATSPLERPSHLFHPWPVFMPDYCEQGSKLRQDNIFIMYLLRRRAIRRHFIRNRCTLVLNYVDVLTKELLGMFMANKAIREPVRWDWLLLDL